MSVKEHKNFHHTMLLAQLRDVKARYRHHQITQEFNRQKVNYPFDRATRRKYILRIADTRYLLRADEEHIRLLKKQILECQRRYTKLSNNRNKQ